MTLSPLPEGPAADRPAAGWYVCPGCDLVQARPPLVRHQRACCGRCGHTLERRGPDSLAFGWPLSLGAMCFLALACLAPFVWLSVSGARHEATLLSGIVALWNGDFRALAPVVLLMSLGFPAARLAGYAYLLYPRRPGRCAAGLAPVLRAVTYLRSWSMVDVYLCATMVAYVKLADIALVGLDVAFAGFVAAMVLTLALDYWVDPRALARLIGRAAGAATIPAQPAAGLVGRRAGLAPCQVCGTAASLDAPHPHCPACGSRIEPRKRKSLSRTLAFTLTAALLYVPANAYPFLIVERFGRSVADTISSGIVSLWGSGLYLVALVVFVASVLVPLLKLVGLGYLTWSVRRHAGRGRVERTRLFRVVELVGRWSMIDVFMISILAALVDFGALASIRVGPGALAFAGVVVATMIAAEAFDSRLIWDVDENELDA